MGGEAPSGAAGAPIAGETGAGGEPGSMAGAPAMGGAPGASGGAGAGGAGGAGGDGNVAPSCQGTPPVCTALNAIQCALTAGCTAAAEKCGGTPSPCEEFLSPSACNSTAGCMETQSGCADDPDPNKPRTACSSYANENQCTNAGCDYVPCAGTATACATFDEATCALHTGCSWQ